MTDIREYIDWILIVGNRMFKDTPHATSWVLWHDPLSIMYSKEGMDYFASVGLGPRRHILCTDYSLPSKYWDKKPGKRAETNPCDEHLNADVEEGIKVLVLMTSDLPFQVDPFLEDGTPNPDCMTIGRGKFRKHRNKKRFLCNTIKELERTYIEAFKTYPTLARIREDILRLPVTLRAIVAKNGAALDPGMTKFHYGGRRRATSAKRIVQQRAAAVRRTELKKKMFAEYGGIMEGQGLELVYDGPHESV